MPGVTKFLTVVFSSDNRGVEPLGVALFSLLECAAASIAYKVYILSNGITEANQRRLQAVAAGTRHSVFMVDVSNLPALLDLPSTERWPVSTWARIFIPDLLPQESGVVLYCDIDLLICRDLTELFATPLNGKAIGVVLEHVSHEGSHFNERLGIPQECPGYFNAGVMLMDLDVFRQQDLVQEIMQYAVANHDKLTCLDQDALNGALCRNLQTIHHKWNWHDGLTRLILKRTRKTRLSRGATLQDSVEAALRPGILHYQGPNKPWRYNHRMERQRYEAVMRRSGFGEFPLPGKTFRKWLKAFLYTPVYWLTWQKIRRLDRHYRELGQGRD